MYPSNLQQRFIEKYAGKKIHPIWKSYDISAYPLDHLRNDFHYFEKIQFKILNFLLKKKSPADVLNFFGVDEQLLPFIRWPKYNFELLYTHLRLDLVPTNDKNFKICELNIDSALGGCDNFQIFRLENFNTSSLHEMDPYKLISNLIRHKIELTNTNKVILLDWSTWKNAGHYNLEWFKKSIEFYIPGIDVFICDENNIIPHLDKNTFVYRIFTAHNGIQNIEFMKRLFESVGFVMNDFTGEIYSSKKWLSLFWDNTFWHLLSPIEIDSIKKWIPITHEITDLNIETFVKNKDNYFFKGISDFGGKSVFYGKEKTEKELISILGKYKKMGLIAQEVINSELLNISKNNKTSSEDLYRCNSVFGLYRFGNEWSSSFLRLSETSNIVNVASGAMAGWAYEKK